MVKNDDLFIAKNNNDYLRVQFVLDAWLFQNRTYVLATRNIWQCNFDAVLIA